MARLAIATGMVAMAAIAFAGSTLRVMPAPRAPVMPGSAEVAKPVSAPLGNGVAGFAIERAPDNHFYADAQVNGARIRFLIDTGASSVVLTRSDAQRAGLAFGDYSAKALAAGGEVRLMPVTLDRVALGPMSASNVPAMVAEEGLPVSLLGQSYLARIGSVEIRGDRMVLR